MELGHMVSLRDHSQISVPGSDFTELLLFSGDRERYDFAELRSLSREVKPVAGFVHAQEFISHNGREVLVDLASEDEAIRSKSVEMVGFARELATSLGSAMVVVHPGGIRKKAGDRERLLRNLERSLDELGRSRLLLENMPWFYWEKGKGRMVSSVCVGLDDLKMFEDLVEGYTLDVCHGYLSRPEGDPGFVGAFLHLLGPSTLHLHVSDARAPDSEGLQIGDGSIDFSFLSQVDVPVVIEVWKGHENGGEGFRTGIERLRALSARA